MVLGLPFQRKTVSRRVPDLSRYQHSYEKSKDQLSTKSLSSDANSLLNFRVSDSSSSCYSLRNERAKSLLTERPGFLDRGSSRTKSLVCQNRPNSHSFYKQQQQVNPDTFSNTITVKTIEVRDLNKKTRSVSKRVIRRVNGMEYVKTTTMNTTLDDCEDDFHIFSDDFTKNHVPRHPHHGVQGKRKLVIDIDDDITEENIEKDFSDAVKKGHLNDKHDNSKVKGKINNDVLIYPSNGSNSSSTRSYRTKKLSKLHSQEAPLSCLKSSKELTEQEMYMRALEAAKKKVYCEDSTQALNSPKSTKTMMSKRMLLRDKVDSKNIMYSPEKSSGEDKLKKSVGFTMVNRSPSFLDSNKKNLGAKSTNSHNITPQITAESHNDPLTTKKQEDSKRQQYLRFFKPAIRYSYKNNSKSKTNHTKKLQNQESKVDMNKDSTSGPFSKQGTTCAETDLYAVHPNKPGIKDELNKLKTTALKNKKIESNSVVRKGTVSGKTEPRGVLSGKDGPSSKSATGKDSKDITTNSEKTRQKNYRELQATPNANLATHMQTSVKDSPISRPISPVVTASPKMPASSTSDNILPLSNSALHKTKSPVTESFSGKQRANGNPSLQFSKEAVPSIVKGFLSPEKLAFPSSTENEKNMKIASPREIPNLASLGTASSPIDKDSEADIEFEANSIDANPNIDKKQSNSELNVVQGQKKPIEVLEHNEASESELLKSDNSRLLNQQIESSEMQKTSQVTNMGAGGSNFISSKTASPIHIRQQSVAKVHETPSSKQNFISPNLYRFLPIKQFNLSRYKLKDQNPDVLKQYPSEIEEQKNIMSNTSKAGNSIKGDKLVLPGFYPEQRTSEEQIPETTDTKQSFIGNGTSVDDFSFNESAPRISILTSDTSSTTSDERKFMDVNEIYDQALENTIRKSQNLRDKNQLSVNSSSSPTTSTKTIVSPSITNEVEQTTNHEEIPSFKYTSKTTTFERSKTNFIDKLLSFGNKSRGFQIHSPLHHAKDGNYLQKFSSLQKTPTSCSYGANHAYNVNIEPTISSQTAPPPKTAYFTNFFRNSRSKHNRGKSESENHF